MQSEWLHFLCFCIIIKIQIEICQISVKPNVYLRAAANWALPKMQNLRMFNPQMEVNV